MSYSKREKRKFCRELDRLIKALGLNVVIVEIKNECVEKNR